MKKASLIILLILILTFIGYIIYNNRYTTFKIEEQGFSMNYPVSYENIESEDKGAKGPIFAVINKYSGINFTVEVLEKQRTTKSIVEIMNNYGATLKVFNLEYDVKILSQNYFLIGDNEAGRVEATISKDSSISKIITVLIPLKNGEITIIFNGTEKAIKNNTNQINKIIDSIKIK